MRKIAVAIATGALTISMATIGIGSAAADDDDPCQQGGIWADSCEVYVDFSSLDNCNAGLAKDLHDSDYHGYKFFECRQVANGSWHVFLSDY